MIRAWVALALFAVGFVLFLLAPLAVLGGAALVYGALTYRGRRRAAAAAATAPAVSAAPAGPAVLTARTPGFGGGVG